MYPINKTFNYICMGLNKFWLPNDSTGTILIKDYESRCENYGNYYPATAFG